MLAGAGSGPGSERHGRSPQTYGEPSSLSTVLTAGWFLLGNPHSILTLTSSEHKDIFVFPNWLTTLAVHSVIHSLSTYSVLSTYHLQGIEDIAVENIDTATSYLQYLS